MALELTEPSFEVIDPRFRRLAFRNVHVERLYTGCRWAEGPAWFAAGRYLVWSDIPNDRMLRWDETDGSVSRVPPAGAQHQRPHRGPPGPPGVLRARRPLRHPHRARRLEHRARLPLRGQALQLAERRGGEVRRQHLVHRPELRHRQRLRGRHADSEIGAATSTASTPRPASRSVAPTTSCSPNGLAFSPDESCSMSPTPAPPHGRRPAPHPGFRCRGRGSCAAAGVRRSAPRACSTAFASTRRATSGPAPATACIATTPDGDAARQDQDAGGGGELCLRRTQAQPPVHLPRPLRSTRST